MPGPFIWGASGPQNLQNPAGGAVSSDSSGNLAFGTLSVGNGGTGVTSVTIAPGATKFAGWDANSNLSSNNFIEGYASTATAGGTTTLTVASAFQQYFTGSSTQTVALPVVSTMVTGQSFCIVNLSSGVVTVQSSGGNTLQAMAANTGLIATCTSTTGTGTASWSWSYGPLSLGSSVTSVTTVGSSPNSSGASISGNVLTLQPSDASNGGVITTASQTIPGQKTFALTPIMSALSATQLVATDSSKQLISVSYGPTPAASRVLQRDANGNGNARAGNFCQDTVSVATAGTTTTLTIASVGYQRFTGSLNQTCKLPSGTTLTAGWQFTIQNVSSGTITVQDGNAGTIATMAANSLYQFVITDVSTTAGAWDIHNLTAGLSNPMTTGGDIIYGGSSGTPTRLANGSSAQYLQSAGGTSAPTWQSFKVPTVQTFTSTGSTVGWLFTISTSSTVAVSDTYTNNGHTYTVIAALSAQTGSVFWASGASAPTASGTLTRSAGAGTSSITFTSAVAYGTYTSPSPAPLYVRVRGVGGGGGGGGSGTADGTAATDGTGSYFGANLIFGTGGAHGVRLTGGVGGTAGLTTAGPIGSSFSGADGGHGVFSNTSPTSGVLGGSGGQTPFGGAGFGGGGGEAGGAAKTNTGSGGGGGGGGATTNVQGGGAGAAGGYFDYIVTSPSATYPYIIGTAGSAGGAGTNGFVGGAGAAGYLEITELYQ